MVFSVECLKSNSENCPLVRTHAVAASEAVLGPSLTPGAINHFAFQGALFLHFNFTLDDHELLFDLLRKSKYGQKWQGSLISSRARILNTPTSKHQRE